MADKGASVHDLNRKLLAASVSGPYPEALALVTEFERQAVAAEREAILREMSTLRTLLFLAYCGVDGYTDDGELQDARTHPFIDFKRDPVDEIDRKMQERGMKALRAELSRHAEGDAP